MQHSGQWPLLKQNAFPPAPPPFSLSRTVSLDCPPEPRISPSNYLAPFLRRNCTSVARRQAVKSRAAARPAHTCKFWCSITPAQTDTNSWGCMQPALSRSYHLPHGAGQLYNDEATAKKGICPREGKSKKDCPRKMAQVE